MNKNKNNPFDVGMELLSVRSDGRRSYLQDVFYPNTCAAKYHPDRLYLGTIYGEDEFLLDRTELKKFFVDTKTSDIALFLGMRGCGKTMSMRACMSRLHKAGYFCLAFDIKGEYRTNVFPISQEFLKKGRLGENEKPEAIPTTMCMPIFLESTYKDPPDDLRFQFSLRDVMEGDLLFILKPSNPNYENAIKLAFVAIQKRKITNLEELRAFLLTKVHDVSKRTVNLSIDMMVQNKLFGEEYPLDIQEIFEKGILALNLTNYESFDTRNGFTQLYAGILLRKIIKLRKDKILKKPVSIFLDEAHFFIPNGSEPPSKAPIIDMINVYRYLGFAGYFSTQYPEQLPEKQVLNQCRHIFLPYNIKNDIMYYMLKKIGAYSFGDVQRNKWKGVKDIMKPYTWMYFDTNNITKPVRLIKFYLPLCDHMIEKRF